MTQPGAGLFEEELTNLISDMKAWEANSVLFFMPKIWWLDALKRREEITRKNTFEQKKKKPGLKFNPGLALIGLRTTGSWTESRVMTQLT